VRLTHIVKRAIDVSLASAILVLGSPVYLVTALLVLILEGRPVFYVSQRYVSPTRAIPVYKFRTMVRDATSPKYRLNERFMRCGYLDIPRNCEVYTPIGRFLERTQIVELPQMLNVLLHGMSLIGNRPMPADNVRLLQQFEGWEDRFASPCGISGIAQVAGKLWLAPEQRMSLEIGYSRVYGNGNVLYCDLVILYYTLRVIVRAWGLPLDDAMRLVNAEPVVRTAATGSQVAV
jgi:lipopolysaccharide/colanic/teichoic acid biosynthesis glycosyltransferase